ncbi:MAG TPA: hypothetical protein VG963_15180 [Polyangiaceae bacterium]|nr:hypothetical protein [Polyangiaceae bacterium]
MLHDALFERALAWVVRERGEAHLLEARRSFERATGTIREGAVDYELRISHFLEQYLCEDPELAIAAFAEANDDLGEDQRRELAGWLRSYRSLFAFAGFGDDGGLVHDCIGGLALRVWPSELDRQLAPGERFDGRVVPLGDLLCLSPGRVYHPREAHEPIRVLLAELAGERLPRPALLDGLLAMRSRYLEFASIRAEHVYQAKAWAGWAASSSPDARGLIAPRQ